MVATDSVIGRRSFVSISMSYCEHLPKLFSILGRNETRCLQLERRVGKIKLRLAIESIRIFVSFADLNGLWRDVQPTIDGTSSCTTKGLSRVSI